MIPFGFSQNENPTSVSASDEDAFSEFEDEYHSEQAKSEVTTKYDPLFPYNRFMYHVNDRLYFIVLNPLAIYYNKIIPEKVRFGIRCFFKNVAFPIRFINNVLQGRFKHAGVEVYRFAVNTTVGILGIRDYATTKLHLAEYSEDFGETLGHWGVGDGVPIVIPFFGFSNIRDAFGLLMDLVFLNPLARIKSTEARALVFCFDKMNYISLHSGEYETLKADALDPYTHLRDLYKQDRDNKIKG